MTTDEDDTARFELFHDAHQKGFREGFVDGMQHAIETARDNPDFRAVACAIVEDWVRELGGRDGADVSIRNRGRRIVGLWNGEGQLAKSASLFDTLTQYDRELRALREQAADKPASQAGDTKEKS